MKRKKGESQDSYEDDEEMGEYDDGRRQQMNNFFQEWGSSGAETM